MTIELTLLACTLLLALFQIMLTAALRTRETGTDYNTGPRDTEGPPVGVLTGRMQRAQKNLFETLPLFIAAVLIVAIAQRESTLSLLGCWMYLLARIAYLPLYAAGVPVVRSLTWLVSVAGLLLVIAATFFTPA
ncbi:membrane protein [Oxalicibacterium flavum]|uniref:Membrane protein n=1 Tax=Oxalicibacterium flavum TaxID=179467 RepID=A0A8J2UQM1_9BURK|nr:MAPEG family protein [Oxalicibacterium flavum]GGC16795.1 membrane protein [Oxalicibacterium flavum]